MVFITVTTVSYYNNYYIIYGINGVKRKGFSEKS